MNTKLWVIICITNMIEIINSLVQLYPCTLLFLLFYAGWCINRRHLPENFVDDPEVLIRKTRAKLRSSTLQCKASSKPKDRRSFIQNLSTEFEAMANKLIREFSAPTTDNIRTGPAAEIDSNFERKPGLSTWCNPASSMGRHTKMLVLIYNTSWRFATHSP